MITTQSILKRKLRSLALRIFLYSENNGNTNFQLNGEELFVDNLMKYLQESCSKEKVVLFDIGANVGNYTQLLLSKSSQVKARAEVHVFEPTYSCFEELQTRFSGLNSVLLNNKAVSNNDGTTKIYYNKQKSGLASLHRRNLNSYSIVLDQSELVETIRLDNYISENCVNHIHFLKIDIEGHELTAFEGFGSYFDSNFLDFIQFEYGGANLDSHSSLMELYELFEKAGFVIAKVMPNGLEIRPYQHWMDNFQYANYVAISRNIVDKL